MNIVECMKNILIKNIFMDYRTYDSTILTVDNKWKKKIVKIFVCERKKYDSENK